MAAPVAEEREGGRRRFLLADDLNAAAAVSPCHIGKPTLRAGETGREGEREMRRNTVSLREGREAARSLARSGHGITFLLMRSLKRMRPCCRVGWMSRVVWLCGKAIQEMSK